MLSPFRVTSSSPVNQLGSLAALLLVATAACGAAEDSSSAGSDDSLLAPGSDTSSLTRFHVTRGRASANALRRARNAPSLSSPASTPPADPSTSTPPTSTPPVAPAAGGDLDAIVAAAQTPDGAAIPQAAGPNGECPAVLVALGFWSCVELNQTCSFTAAGVRHVCSCDRTDGEGQYPSWVCDP
jgi:hypothetical protein